MIFLGSTQAMAATGTTAVAPHVAYSIVNLDTMCLGITGSSTAIGAHAVQGFYAFNTSQHGQKTQQPPWAAFRPTFSSGTSTVAAVSMSLDPVS
jgi:hypothetical protein